MRASRPAWLPTFSCSTLPSVSDNSRPLTLLVPVPPSQSVCRPCCLAVISQSKHFLPPPLSPFSSLVAQWLRICCNAGGPGFNPWVGKIPWRRAWQRTPVFLPGEFHGQRSLAGYSPWGCRESDRSERLIV